MTIRMKGGEAVKEVPEPLLISAMRNHPTGEVCHIPNYPIGKMGTTTKGFLAELDEWIDSIRESALESGS